METEYLRVDSSTVIYVELKCISSGLDAEQKSILRKEILQLAKDDIQHYVEKFDRKKKKSTLTENGPVDKKGRSSVIRGQDVKFLYEFTKVSITHRVLTRGMHRGSRFKGCEVFPEKLVIYYQPYCKIWKTDTEQESSQRAISNYFKKPGNQNEEPQPLKTALSKIVSKSGPKLSKMKKSKWTVMSVCEQNPVTVPERPDPFKQMAEEDDRNRDTWMKMALVKDTLVALQEDLAAQKENRRPKQEMRNFVEYKVEGVEKVDTPTRSNEPDSHIPPADKENADKENTEQFPIIASDDNEMTPSPAISSGHENEMIPSPAEAGESNTANSQEIHDISSENIANYSGDFSIEIDGCDNEQKGDNEQKDDDKMSTASDGPELKSPAQQTETDSFDDDLLLPQLLPRSDSPESRRASPESKSPIQTTENVSFDDDLLLPQLLPRPASSESLEVKDKCDKEFEDDQSQSEPSPVMCLARIDPEDSLPQIDSEHLKDSDDGSESAGEQPSSPACDNGKGKSQPCSSELPQNDSFGLKPRSPGVSGKRLTSKRLSSKSSQRLSRKIALMELSDSDSDWNIGELESHENNNNDKKKEGVGLEKKSQTTVCEKGSVTSSPEKGDCNEKLKKFVFKKPMLSISARNKERGKSNSLAIKKKSDDICMTAKGNNDFLGDSGPGTSYDSDDLPDIVHTKRTVLKRRKPRPKEVVKDVPTSTDMEQNEDDDLPTIASGKSKLRRLGPRTTLQKSKKTAPNLFLPDEPECLPSKDFAAASKSSDSCESKSDGQSDDAAAEACVIEDDSQEDDRLLMEISNVREMKHLTEEQLEYLVTTNIDYAKDILKARIYCERHEKYKKGKRQQILLRNEMPLGQFREAQHEVVMDILMNVFCSNNPQRFDYVCKVILPEMLIKICMDVKHLSHAEAQNNLETFNMSQMDDCGIKL